MSIKINLMDTESTPSDDEIRSFMNFDKVVEEARKQSRKPTAKKFWIVAPVTLALLSVWFIVRNTSQSAEQIRIARSVDGDDSHPEQEQPRSMPGSNKDSTTTNIDSNTSGEEHEYGKKAVPSVAPLHKDQKSALVDAEKQTSQSLGVKDERGVKNETGVKDERLAGSDVYVQAEPRHGYTQLYAYFSKNLEYPEAAVKDSIEGVEMVSFTIDEQGRPMNIRVTQSLGKLFDEEAVRLIREMPDWIPATLNERPVASQLSLPLTFEITRLKKQ